MYFFIIICSETATSEMYFVTPLVCSNAKKQPCLTLSQFAANASDYPNSNITLNILPGNHNLHSRLHLTNLDIFSMVSESSTATIVCQEPANIFLQSISQVSIEKMEFIGCGGNVIHSVGQALFQNAMFYGWENSSSALRLTRSGALIVNCFFMFNTVGTYAYHYNNKTRRAGGAIVITHSDISIIDSNFEHNLAEAGGAVMITHSNISIINCNFEDNSAGHGGAVLAEQYSNITLIASTFAENYGYNGGVLFIRFNTSIIIRECWFSGNFALWGGVALVFIAKIDIEATIFSQNSAINEGGVLLMYDDSRTNFNASQPNNNELDVVDIHHPSDDSDTGNFAGVGTSGRSDVYISDSIFSNNTAGSAGVLSLFQCNVTILTSQFVYSSAAFFRDGAVHIEYGTATIQSTGFSYNTACNIAGALSVIHVANFVIRDIEFTNNLAPSGAACVITNSTIISSGYLIISGNSATFSTVYFRNSTANFMGSVIFSHNTNSFYAYYNSFITFEGQATFKHSTSVTNLAFLFQEGGAMTVYRSTVILKGTCSIEHNHADNGGAMLVARSKVYVDGEITIANNTARQNGGGVYLYQSELKCQEKGVLKLVSNRASVSGGAVHAITSDITVLTSSTRNEDTFFYTGAQLIVIQNIAERGGGISIELNSKLYILKLNNYYYYFPTIGFVENSANYGGALYVADDTNYGVCSSTAISQSPLTECFFQVVYTKEESSPRDPTLFFNRVKWISPVLGFAQNSASTSGSILFGGLLDRCTSSSILDSRLLVDGIFDGIFYLTNFTDMMEKNFTKISSHPVRVCFCSKELHNCSLQSPLIQVKKGETFMVSLVAVNQIRNVVNATIQSSLASSDSGLGEGQLSQNVEESSICNDLTFSVFSPHNSENLTLYADGPCKDAEPSTKTVHIQFLPCSCPVGFQPSPNENTRCVCECHDDIKQNVECNITTESFLRRTNVWVSYVNSNETSGYLLYPHCPFDYCGLLSVPINLNQLNGGDTQCTFNRSGLLCGGCQPGLSLSLGSSRCLSCPTNWPGLLTGITLAAILAGIGLVAFLLLLNVTVAVGTLNALIFYANIVEANNSVLLPFSKQNFVTVFISWLNFEIGIDTCYFQGMNSYTKTWLQLAFPIYIFFLVVLIIIISHHSSKFAQLIARKSPVATLATLIMLSYSKLLKTTIAALSYGVLNYPDGSTHLVWLPDASVKYLSGEHIPLFIAAVFILLVGLIYTTLLFSWQWLVCLPRWTIFRWVRNQKLRAFIEAYNAPYTNKHRYWTGLLLYVRAILYLVSAINISGDPQVQLSSAGFVCGTLIFFKAFTSNTIFKAWPLDVLETLTLFNISAYITFSWYALNTNANQEAVAFTSVTIMIAVLVVTVFYHLHRHTTAFSVLIRTKCFQRLNMLCCKHLPNMTESHEHVHKSEECIEVVDLVDHPINAHRRPKAKPTFSIIEISDAHDQTQSPQHGNNTVGDPHISVEHENPSKQKESPESPIHQDKCCGHNAQEQRIHTQIREITSGADYETAHSDVVLLLEDTTY